MSGRKSPRRWVVLLRAVNVGGHGVVKMADLAAAFESCGCSGVVTYLRSGNVVFEAPAGRAERDDLARLVERALEQQAGVRNTPFLLSPAELRAAAEANPFEPARRHDQQHCHLVFLSDRPEPARVSALLAAQGDEYRFAVEGAVSATARTWKVVEGLLALAER